MKIKEIRVVQVNIPHVPPSTPPRRPSWNESAPRQMPINKYGEFSKLPSELPSIGGGEVWVKITAEDGTWGLGSCGFGETTAVVIDYVFAPLLTGPRLPGD